MGAQGCRSPETQSSVRAQSKPSPAGSAGRVSASGAWLVVTVARAVLRSREGGQAQDTSLGEDMLSVGRGACPRICMLVGREG